MKLVSKFLIKNTFRVLLKQIYIPLLSLVLFTNCSSTLMLPGESDYEDNLEKLNKLGGKYSSDIYLVDSTIFSGSNLNVSRDSIYFLNNKDKTNIKLSTEQVEAIVIRNTGYKILGGILTGIAVGGIVAILIRNKEYNKSHGFYIPPTLLYGTCSGLFSSFWFYVFSGEEEFIFYEVDE